MKIKYYDYKYLLILLLAVIIIGNGCGVFGGIKLYEGASGAHTHGGDKKEGNTSKKKDKKGSSSSSPMGVGVPKSKKHKKWEQEVLFTEAKRDRRLLLAKRVQAKKDAAEREKEMAKKKAEMDAEKAKLKAKQDEQKAEWEAQAENREMVGLDF